MKESTSFIRRRRCYKKKNLRSFIKNTANQEFERERIREAQAKRNNHNKTSNINKSLKRKRSEELD